MNRSLLRVALLASLAGCGHFEALRLASPDAGRRDYKVESPISPRSASTIRFFAVGDAGEPDPEHPGRSNPGAREVAALVGRVCEARGGCDFGVFLGDNIYNKGIDSLDPEDRSQLLFQDLVARYEGALVGGRVPLFFVLGNHDWGPALIPYGASPSSARADRELETVARCLNCRGDAHFYELTAGPVQMFAWDTNYLVHRCDEGATDCALEGRDKLDGPRRSMSPWRVVVGHHPYFSNGEHGDAGSFVEGPGFSLWPGQGFRRLMDEHVVGVADLYIAGHDHNLQAFPDATTHRGRAPGLNRTAVIVSGSGSKVKALRGSRAHAGPHDFGEERLGFTMVEATRDRLVVELHEVHEGPALRPAFRMVKDRAGGAFRVE